jgi:hypothetical protein
MAHAYRTVLHNHSRGDVTLEVREQIPVSKQADIRVVLDEKKTTAGYSLDARRGHLTWHATLKKGAEDKRDTAFTIELPKDWSVP